MKYLKIILCIILAVICVTLLSPILAFLVWLIGGIALSFLFMILWDNIGQKISERWNL